MMSAAVPVARPRIPAVVSLVVGVIAAVVAIISLANAPADGALLGGGLIAAVVAVIAFLFTGYGFQLARSASARLPASGPLMLLAFLAMIIGVIGSMGAFILSSAVASQNGVAVAIIVLLLAVVVTIAGFRLVRVARQGRPSN